MSDFPFSVSAAIALVVVQIGAIFQAWQAARGNVIEAVKHE